MIHSVHNYICNPITVESSTLEKIAVLCIQPAHFLMATCTYANVTKMNYLKGKCIKPVEDWVAKYRLEWVVINEIRKVAYIIFFGVSAVPLTIIGYGLHQMALKLNGDVRVAYQQLIDFRKNRVLHNAVAGNYEHVKELSEKFPPDLENGQIFGKNLETNQSISDPETFNAHFELFQNLLDAALTISKVRCDEMRWAYPHRVAFLEDSMKLIFTILNACPADRIKELIGPHWPKHCLQILFSDLIIEQPAQIRSLLRKLPEEIVQEGLRGFSIVKLSLLFNAINDQSEFEIMEQLYNKGIDPILDLLLEAHTLPLDKKRFYPLEALGQFLDFEVVRSRLTGAQKDRIANTLLTADPLQSRFMHLYKDALVYSTVVSLKKSLIPIFSQLGIHFFEGFFKKRVDDNRSCLDDWVDAADSQRKVFFEVLVSFCMKFQRVDLLSHFCRGVEGDPRSAAVFKLAQSIDPKEYSDILVPIIQYSTKEDFLLLADLLFLIKTNFVVSKGSIEKKIPLIKILDILIYKCPKEYIGPFLRKLEEAKIIEYLMEQNLFEYTPQLFLTVHSKRSLELNQYFFSRYEVVERIINEGRLDFFGFGLSDLSVVDNLLEIDCDCVAQGNANCNACLFKTVFSADSAPTDDINTVQRYMDENNLIAAFGKLLQLDYPDLARFIDRNYLRLSKPKLDHSNFDIFIRLVWLTVESISLTDPIGLRKALVTPSEENGQTLLHSDCIFYYFASLFDRLKINPSELIDENGVSAAEWVLFIDEDWLTSEKSLFFIEPLSEEEYHTRAVRLEAEVLDMWNSFRFGTEECQVKSHHFVVEGRLYTTAELTEKLIAMTDSIVKKTASTGTPSAHDPEALHKFYTEMLVKFDVILNILKEKEDPNYQAGMLIEIAVTGFVCQGGWKEGIDQKHRALVRYPESAMFQAAACNALYNSIEVVVSKTPTEVISPSMVVHWFAHLKFAVGLSNNPDPVYKLMKNYSSQLAKIKSTICSKLMDSLNAFLNVFGQNVAWEEVEIFLMKNVTPLTEVLRKIETPQTRNECFLQAFAEGYAKLGRQEMMLVDEAKDKIKHFCNTDKELEELLNAIRRLGGFTLPLIAEGEDLVSTVQAEEQEKLNQLIGCDSISVSAFIAAAEERNINVILAEHNVEKTMQRLRNLNNFWVSSKKRMNAAIVFAESVKKVTQDPNVMITLIPVHHQYQQKLMSLLPEFLETIEDNPELDFKKKKLRLQFDPNKFRYPSEYLDDVYRSWKIAPFQTHKRQAYIQVLSQMGILKWDQPLLEHVQ